VADSFSPAGPCRTLTPTGLFATSACHRETTRGLPELLRVECVHLRKRRVLGTSSGVVYGVTFLDPWVCGWQTADVVSFPPDAGGEPEMGANALRRPPTPRDPLGVFVQVKGSPFDSVRLLQTSQIGPISAANVGQMPVSARTGTCGNHRITCVRPLTGIGETSIHMDRG
jgi:hypothetical protein